MSEHGADTAATPPGRDASGALQDALARVDQPLFAYRDRAGRLRFALRAARADATQDLVAHVPALPPAVLGDRAFLAAHGARVPYVAGAMAGGIAGVELGAAMAAAGGVAFFGSGGLALPAIERAVAELARRAPGRGWGINLLASPQQPAREVELVELALRHGVGLLSASAFTQLTPALVWYRAAGLERAADGRVVVRHRVSAKLSRLEVARAFLEPPPEAMLAELVRAGRITGVQAELARQLPVADEIDAEADSGGHTDNRPALALLEAVCDLRDELCRDHGYAERVRVGLGGGIGTARAAAAAFAAGAAYVVAGSIHQACVEADTSEAAKRMLAAADFDSVAMCPAADMFELGVQLQVLRAQTLFAARARKLGELYRTRRGLDDLSDAERRQLEKTVFRSALDDVWRQVEEHFATVDPALVQAAARDPKLKMALVFRWYLGLSSRWAKEGVAERAVDFQIWCSPAMGAFNRWARGSVLEPLAARTIRAVAGNVVHGACAVLRAQTLAQQLRVIGFALPDAVTRFRPRASWALAAAAAAATPVEDTAARHAAEGGR